VAAAATTKAGYPVMANSMWCGMCRIASNNDEGNVTGEKIWSYELAISKINMEWRGMA